MTNNWKQIVLGILVFGLVVGGIYYFYQRQVNDLTEPEIITETQEGFPTTEDQEATAQPTPTSVAASQPDTGIGDVKNIGIVLSLPARNSLIYSPVKVTGRANVYEGHVSIRIKDSSGKVLGSGFATACMDVDACPFEALIPFSNPQTSTGTVEAFSPSPADGSEQFLQSATVNFK